MPTSDFWVQKRVLITGNTGFKGSWLSLWLRHLGANVCGVSLEPSSSDKLLFPQLINDSSSKNLFSSHFVQEYCDINDFTELQKVVKRFQPEVVFHLAAQSLVRSGYSYPLNTWSTNVQGSVNIMRSLMGLDYVCSVVMVTTDKVYQNNEWEFGYRENDPLGGLDPYSASKAAAELAISSWRHSFCGDGELQSPYLTIASARSGNVVGGGDWSENRIIPDLVRSLSIGQSLKLRNPSATRPWQHVLEPLFGYLILAEKMYSNHLPGRMSNYATSFNFGPDIPSNRSVKDLVELSFKYWPGDWEDTSVSSDFHEAQKLHLQNDKAYTTLGWSPKWNFSITVERTIKWYLGFHNGVSPIDLCLSDIIEYESTLKDE